jgi:Protein of unknown function DUF86
LLFATASPRSQSCTRSRGAPRSISEAVRRIPDAWLADFPSEPWGQIKGIGNRIRHEYFRVDDAILWDIITKHTHALKTVMEAMLARHASNGPTLKSWHRNGADIQPTRTNKDHRAALAEIAACWGAPEGTEEGDRLDVLLTLVKLYEAKR